jgi:hypothetical protein
LCENVSKFNSIEKEGMNKIFIFSFIFILAFPLIAQQGEIREKKNIGITSGGGVGIGASMINTGIIWNLNQYFSLGLNVASGRHKYRETTNGGFFEWKKEYDYSETIGYATLSIFPIKNWPFLVSGHLGSDSGMQGRHTTTSFYGNSISITELAFHKRAQSIYGGSIGVRYYSDSGFFWGLDLGTLVRDYSMDSVYVKYSNALNRNGESLSLSDSYLNLKVYENLIKTTYSNDSRGFAPFYNIYFGISF